MPATIAVLGGVPHVGLTQQQLEHIAQRGPAVRLHMFADACLVVQCRRFHQCVCHSYRRRLDRADVGAQLSCNIQVFWLCSGHVMYTGRLAAFR